MGRPRKPVAEKKRDGSYRKDRESANPVEPVVMLSADECPAPDHLTKPQKAAWDDVVAAVVHLGTLSKADLLHMELAAVQMALLRELVALHLALPEFDDEGELHEGRLKVGKDITTATGRTQHLLDRLGLNPSARGKLDKGEPDAPSKMANLVTKLGQ